MPRKTTGCWTCRARKKKCDDGRPSCAACALRGIACYGYGAKPAWMDGGDQERRMLCTMKLRAKESYSQRRRSRARRGSSRHASLSTVLVAGSPGTLGGSEYGESPPAQHGEFGKRVYYGQHNRQYAEVSAELQAASNGTGPLDPRHFPSEVRDAHDAPPAPAPAAPASLFSGRAEVPAQLQTPATRTGSDFPYSESELSLLMYYFDHLFPRLCPFFVYSPGDKGRGWLLSLFLRTKPLCAAAICISSCDQAQWVLGPLSDIPQPRHDLEMQHIQIVVDLRAHLAQLSEQTGASRMAVVVEALACIMHLVLFELWIPRRGIMNDWVMHMDAATALLSSVDLTMVGSASPPSASSPMALASSARDNARLAATAECAGYTGHARAAGDGYNSSSDNEHKSGATADRSNDDAVRRFFPVEFLTDGERAAFDFFLTQYTYCCVMATLGLGLTPQLAESVSRTHAIFHDGQTQLRDMMGVEDWLLNTVLDIAVLKSWKQRERSTGRLSLRELARRADAIEARLKEGLAQITAATRRESMSTGTESAATSPTATRQDGLSQLASAAAAVATVLPRGSDSVATAWPSRAEKSRIISRTVLHAALLFLHVVVSGFYPNLPEIHRAVLLTLDAIEDQRAQCDINIPSWPYCVAGCLALESEFPRVRAVSAPHQPGTHPLVMTRWTLDIIERTWEMRAALPQTEESPSWAAAMNDMGSRLLLI